VSIASEFTAAGVAAVKAGNLAAARVTLAEALSANRDDATAWLWLSATVEATEEKRYCLQQVLRIAPNNPAALKGMAQLGEGPASAPVLHRASVVVEAPAVAPPASMVPPKKQGIGCVGGLVLLVVFLGIGYGFLSAIGPAVTYVGAGSGRNAGGRNAVSGPDEMSAFLVCQNFVRARLKAPASAEFPSINDQTTFVTDEGGGRYQVDSHVDSQNSFGATLRMEYACHVRYTDSENGNIHFDLEKLTTSED
jgi:hypothetical protein